MSPKQVIKTSNAPDPVGPYNQAIKAGDFIYCSGQIAIDPALNEITCLGNIEKETIQVLKNLEAVLKAGGAKIEDVIKTSNAPDPVGPYNQAIKAGDFIYCSGQIAIDPALNEITCLGDIEKETIQVLKNLAAVLKAGGAKIEDVVKTTIFLTDLSNFEIVNKIYSEFFSVKNPPARACVEVSSLPKGVLIEIDCVAFLD